MAEARDLSLSTTEGSDEIQEMSCEQCEKHTGIYEVAEGFCVDCVEYMCATCLVYHKRYVPGHKQLNNVTMPMDFCFEKCSSHPNQLIKFYCENCDTFACTECKTNTHQSCKKMAHLPTIVKGIEHSRELEDLLDKVNQLSVEIEEIEKQIDSNNGYVDTLEINAKSVIQQQKDKLVRKFKEEQQSSIEQFDKKMTETIEKLKRERQEMVELTEKQQKLFVSKVTDAEKCITKTVNERKHVDQTKLNSLLYKNECLKKEVNNLKSDIVLKKNTLQRCRIFMKMKSSHKIIEKMQTKTKMLQNSIEVNPYEITTFEPLADLVGKKTRLFLFKDIHKSYREKCATFHSESDLTQLRSKPTSMCFIFDRDLLLIGNKNESLIRFKGISHTVIALESTPSDIAQLEWDKVAVTFPNLGMVALLTISQQTNVVAKYDEIIVGRGCCGVACCQGNLVVSFTHPAKVQVTDTSGNVLLTFQNDSQNFPLFSYPRYIAVSPDNTGIYVSDSYRNTVTGVKFDGSVLGVYKDDALTEPAKLIVDPDGSVLVCGQMSNNVHLLSNDLEKVSILLNRANGMKEPVSVLYDQNDKKLFVGMTGKRCIKVFKLS